MTAGVLRQIQATRDVNYLTEEDLQLLCAEMRQVDGGLGAGVCELAVALHRTFDMPPDRIAFGDASILRACELIHADYGLPDPDAVGTAIGQAWARDLKRQTHHVVAVDSHAMDRRLAGRERNPLIVIHMRPLGQQRPVQPRPLAQAGELLGRKRRHAPGEPIDGRDIGNLLLVLEEAKEQPGLQRLEVLVEPSRRRKDSDPIALSGPFPSFKEVLAQRLFELARADVRFVWIGSHPGPFGREYPERYIEWEGPAEHTLAIAASMGAEGIPVVASVRASEVPRCLGLLARKITGPRLPVTLVIDEDDAELEVASLRVLPNVSIAAPADENDLRAMITAAIGDGTPAAVCCPRGAGVGVPLLELAPSQPAPRAERLSTGADVAILALGRAVYPAILAARKLIGYSLNATVVNMRSVRPLDETVLLGLIDEGVRKFLTVEEGTLVGGMGGAVMETLHRRGISNVEVRALGREENPLATGLLGPHDPDAIVAGVLAFVPTPPPKG